jgi:hypothetical protein
MRCTTCRTQLHTWFDSHGSDAMPLEVGEHIRDCSECRTFIKSWNSVELGLQSIQSHSTNLSSDFAVRLRARLAREEGRRRYYFPFPAFPAFNYGRLAVAAVAAVMIVIAIRYSGGIRSMLNANGPTVAVHRSGTSPIGSKTNDVKPAIPRDLPFAKTP